MPITKSDLDKTAARGCQAPGCTHENHDQTLFLASRCHPYTGVDVSYTAGSGLLRIACRECDKLVAMVKVAEE